MNLLKNFELPTGKKDWLIVGKGPTFENIDDYDLDQFNIIALNHVANYIPLAKPNSNAARLCCLIDLDVLKLVSRYNADPIILMPLYPHVGFKPWIGSEFVDKSYPNVVRFSCSTWKKEQPDPIIKVKYNVAEAAFGILIYFGVKKIYTLGVDGGTKYAKTFSDLTPLTNGRNHFDDQLKAIESQCITNGVMWNKL